MLTSRDESHHIADPVAVGAQREDGSTTTAQGLVHGGAVLSCRLRIVRSQLRGGGELAGAARFRVVQDHVTEVGKLEIPAVENLDGEQFVTSGQRPQG